MHPILQTLHDIVAGRQPEQAGLYLHLAFGHIGDGEGNFSTRNIFSADQALPLIPLAEAASANPGDVLSDGAFEALENLINDDVGYEENCLLVAMGMAEPDDGPTTFISKADAVERWNNTLDAIYEGGGVRLEMGA